MANIQNSITDTDIIYLIQKNDSLGWEYLHDKFAPTLYIAILWVINDEKRSHEILNMMFSQFKTNTNLLETQNSLSKSLLYHTCITSLKILNIHESTERNAINFNYQQQ